MKLNALGNLRLGSNVVELLLLRRSLVGGGITRPLGRGLNVRRELVQLAFEGFRRSVPVAPDNLHLQMIGTVTPLVLFPELCFTVPPIAPTLEGQYVIKNLVLITAGIVIGATVHGGRLSANLQATGRADRTGTWRRGKSGVGPPRKQTRAAVP